MKKSILLILVIVLASCKTQHKRYIQKGLNKFQQELDASYKDVTKTPLKKEDFKNFKGLDFYPVDKNLIINAKLTKTPNAKTFKFQTTTDRTPLYKSYGIVAFTIDGVFCKLTIYKNQDLNPKPGYENYLFLPYTDLTSGNTTYGGGRYMELFTTDENEDGTITLNFNNSYNPYCAYNEKYSCPLTPVENHLDIIGKAKSTFLKSKSTFFFRTQK